MNLYTREPRSQGLSIEEFLAFATKKIEIRHYDRADGWREEVAAAGARQLALPALGTALRLADICRHTHLARR